MVVCLSACCSAPAAAEQRLVTWDTPSRFVDVRTAPEPRAAPPRPAKLSVNILLPDGYDGDRRFPILYLLHGQGDGYADWARPSKGDVQRVAKGFPGIIVMPEGWSGFYSDWWNGGRRGNPAWESYHLRELIPLVERRLRVRPGRRWHAIAGLSMGGYGAMYYASQRPGYFGTAASFSGAISLQGLSAVGGVIGDMWGPPDGFYAQGHDPVRLTDSLRLTRLYVSVGDGIPNPSSPSELGNVAGAALEAALRPASDQFVAAARASGAEVTYRPHHGIHDWPYWRADLADAVRWNLFKWVPEAPGRWTYRTVAQAGEMWGLAYRFERPPEAVASFSFEDGTLAADGTGTVTIETQDGCRFSAALPFRRVLPSGCCLVSTGRAEGKRLGQARLGRTHRAQRRGLKAKRRLAAHGALDRYCTVGGGSFRVGYPSRRLNSRISRRQRARVRRRAILILTSSGRFSVKGITPGASVRMLRRTLHGERRVRVGRNVWYLAPGRSARLVYKTRRGRVLEVGIADRGLTNSRRLARTFLRAWRLG